MNERIDHTNYEAWLLDRLEGNLTADQELALDGFLLQHPELATAMDELPKVEEGEVQLTKLDKESLKRRLPPAGLVSKATLDDHLIARLEGDLDQAQLDALHIYLQDHPEHMRSERLFALTKLVPEALLYAAKTDVARHFPPQGTITLYTLDDHLVARLEGALNADQESALTVYLAAHPEAQRSWTLMRATRVADPAVIFPNKASLKKGGRIISIGRVSGVQLAAAATVALLLAFGAWLLKAPSVEAPDIVQVTPKIMAPAPGQHQDDVEVAPLNNVPKSDVQPHSNELATPAPGNGAPQKDRAPDVLPRLAPLPIEREEPLPIAQQLPGTPRQLEAPRPDDVVLPVVLREQEEPMAAAATVALNTATRTVGQLLAATVRERVLEQPKPESRPLDGNDAVAMVDLGLKAVAGDRTGLALERKDDGAVRGFNLRLGRNLSISASR